MDFRLMIGESMLETTAASLPLWMVGRHLWERQCIKPMYIYLDISLRVDRELLMLRFDVSRERCFPLPIEVERPRQPMEHGSDLLHSS